MVRRRAALAGFVDIVMEMRCVCWARSKDRRRRICAYSRYAETPRQLFVELTDDGKEYTVQIENAGPPRLQACVEAEHVLSHAYEKLTVEDILKWWPDTSKTPDRSTLSRCLNRAVCRSPLSRHFFAPAFVELFTGALAFAFFLSLPCALLPFAMVKSFQKKMSRKHHRLLFLMYAAPPNSQHQG